MPLVKTSLNAVTADAIGSVLSFDTPRSFCGAQVVVSGASASGSVSIEGSLNGTDFFTIGSAAIAPDNTMFIQGSGMVVLHLRARLGGFSGSATVTAIVAGAAA